MSALDQIRRGCALALVAIGGALSVLCWGPLLAAAYLMPEAQELPDDPTDLEG